MLNSLSSNAVNAKARAIYGKRLTTADYRELMRQRTVSDVASYLKTNTSYAKVLSGISETQIHRGQLETLLHRARLEKYLSLLHYDFSGSGGFYHYVVMNVEVGVLLSTIMLLNSNSMQDIIVNVPSYMQEYVCIDFMKLSKIRDFDDLLSVLSATPYKNILKPFSAPNGDISLSECEHALKCFYYRTILNSIDKYYKGKTRKDLRQIVLIEIEILNLSLIYRLKTFFHRSPGEIQRELLPFYYKLTPRSLELLLEPLPDQKFVEYANLSSYSVYSAKMKDIQFNYVEDYTRHLIYFISRKLIRFSASAPVAFYSLMTLSQIELENITTIIEGIRYGNPVSEIEKLLILE